MKNSVICNEIYHKIGNVNSILDVGCGEGYLVNCLARKLNKRAIGFDISDHGFFELHEKCKKSNTCSLIKCVNGDAHNIGNYFKPKKFDAITLIYTFHHLKKPLTALKSIKKILKDNGKIIIGDYWFTNRKKKQGCYKFTPQDIKKLLRQSKFRYFGEDRIRKDFVLIVGEK